MEGGKSGQGFPRQVTPSEVMDFIARTPPGTALDLGCGTGSGRMTYRGGRWRKPRSRQVVQGSAMEQMELFVSWIRDAVNSVSQNSFDPKSWGVLFAVLVLLSIWSIVRALTRLARQLSIINPSRSGPWRTHFRLVPVCVYEAPFCTA